MSYIWRSTLAAGTLVPFLNEVALPGDTFDIDLNAVVMTHPTIGPLFGSYKVQLDVFQCPVRLYQGQLHNNKIGIGMNMATIKMPIMKLKATPFAGSTDDIDNHQINPSCLLAYLGIRGVGINDTTAPITRDFNAIPLLAYWDIYKNYYANKQEEIGVVIHTTREDTITTVTSISILTFGTLPEAPATPVNFVIDNTWAITINFSGTIPKPEQIIITTDQGEFTVQQLFNQPMILNGTGDAIGSNYNMTKGTITFFSWRYKTDNEQVTVF